MKRLSIILAALVLLTTAGVADQHQSENVDTVMLASDANFPDALMAAGPAEKLGIPVLITEQDELPTETADALEDLAPSEIEIVGGPAVVSDDLRTQLETDYNVTRYWGMTQVGTSAALADAFWPNGAEEAIVVQYPQDGDAYWDDGYKLLAALRGIVEDRPVLISQEGTLSATTTEAVADLEVSSVDVYSTNAVNVTSDLEDMGVEDVTVTEGDLNELMEAIETEKEADDENETESKSRPLVAVASESYKDALAVSSSPDAASYLVSSEDEIDGLVERIQSTNVSRVIVTGQPERASTIATRVRNETDVDVKETSGNAAAASAANVRDSRAEWAQQQKERTAEFRESIRSSSNFADKVQGLLNKTESKLQGANISDSDRADLQEELDEAWADYEEGEYLDAREEATGVRSELREFRYEDARENGEAIRELVKTERESFNELAQDSKELMLGFREDLREAETPEERAEIIKEFREERRETIQKHQDSIQNGLDDLPGNRSGDEMEDSESAFTTQWGEGKVEIESEQGGINVKGEAMVNTGGYTVNTTSSQSGSTIDVTFNLISPDGPATQALTMVEFEESFELETGSYYVMVDVQVDGQSVFDHAENATVKMSDDGMNDTQETEENSGSVESGGQNTTHETADVWLEPNRTVAKGDNHTVDLMVEADGTIGAYESTVTVENKEIASFSDTFFHNDPGLSNASYSDNRNQVELAVAIMNETGETKLATLVVDGDAVGETNLNLDATVGDAAGNPYETTTSDGLFTVEDAVDSAWLGIGQTIVNRSSTTSLDIVAEGESIAGYSVNLTYDASAFDIIAVNGTETFDEPVVNDGTGWTMFSAANANGTDHPDLATVVIQTYNVTGDYPVSFVETNTSVNTETDTLSIESYADGTVSIQ